MGCDMTRGSFSAFSFCIAFFCPSFCALGMEWSILPHLQSNDKTSSRGAWLVAKKSCLLMFYAALVGFCIKSGTTATRSVDMIQLLIVLWQDELPLGIVPSRMPPPYRRLQPCSSLGSSSSLPICKFNGIVVYAGQYRTHRKP